MERETDVQAFVTHHTKLGLGLPLSPADWSHLPPHSVSPSGHTSVLLSRRFTF